MDEISEREIGEVRIEMAMQTEEGAWGIVWTIEIRTDGVMIATLYETGNEADRKTSGLGENPDTTVGTLGLVNTQSRADTG